MKRFLIALGCVLLLVIAAGFVISVNSRIEKIEKVDGVTERHFFFGKLLGERNYRNGELNGITRLYYADGKIKAEWNFLNGRRHGAAKHYSLDGNLRYVDEYAHGERISRKEYDERGNLVAEESESG